MAEERRAKEKQTHRMMMSLLNDNQQEVVSQYEMFDWNLIFVRQPPDQDVVPVLKARGSGRYAILEPDGSLNEDHDLIVRQ